MALNASAPTAHVSETFASPSAEDEEMYIELLRIRDSVIAGKHPQFQLPPAVIEQLKASAALPSIAVHPHELSNGTAAASRALLTSHAPSDASQPSHAAPAQSSHHGLPGLHALMSASGEQAASYAGINPVLLEKSDSLVRAEGQLKRQRIERELQMMLEQRKHTARDRDVHNDAPSTIDVEAILSLATARAQHVSGLKAASKPHSPASSSFDENDYYSSQVQSDWSSDSSSSRRSDRAAGAFMADFERLDERGGSSALPAAARIPPPDRTLASPMDLDDEYDPEEVDDEYSPPDASALEDPDVQGRGITIQPATPYDDEDDDDDNDDDDNSEYEPGDLDPAEAWSRTYGHGDTAAQDSPQAPVFRNHLTHIAAPQPNRVSPLAVAKGPSIELELVNGRPEVVQKRRHKDHSQASTASASGDGTGASAKKLSKRAKKRKRRVEAEAAAQTKATKKKQKRQARTRPIPSPVHTEPIVKNEPISPVPLFNPRTAAAGAGAGAASSSQYVPATETGVAAARQPYPPQYVDDGIHQPKRYEPAHQSSALGSHVAASPATHRPAPRDNQDLRRIASLQYAQRPRSPTQPRYASNRTASMPYGIAQQTYYGGELDPPRYQEYPPNPIPYVRGERSPSPARLQDQHDPYASRGASPAMMPPPSAPPRRIVIDQYGNRYYAAEPQAPLPQSQPARASVAPIERQAPAELSFERAPSRASAAYAPQYDPVDGRMAPPPQFPPQPTLPRRISDETQVYYVDSNEYQARRHNPFPPEPVRYVEQAPSPVYQQLPSYNTMVPPPAPMPPQQREQTSPVYAPRGYSVRPEERVPPTQAYVPRQASIAPVQYVRQDAPPPPRAMSVVPGYDPAMPQRDYSYAPQQVRYIDQHGQEIYPQEVRQVSEFRY